MQTAERSVSPELQATYERFKSMRDAKSPEWFNLLNTIRYFELRGGGYLAYLAEVLEDPDMMAKMTKHAADESKHAHFVNLMIRRDGGTLQSKYAQQTMGFAPPTNGCPPRESLIQVFAAMQAIEKRAQQIFAAFELVYDDDPVVLSMVREVIKDEQFHISWIARYLEKWREDGYAEQIDRALTAQGVQVQQST